MLELRNVSKHYSGIPAVDNVSFNARPGEVTGYLGPNGSGKTTTLKMITGLIEMTFGQILFQGKPIQDDLIAYKRSMGYVPEEPYLYNHLSGAEYLTMVSQLRNLPPRQTSECIDGLLRMLSLYDDRHASIAGYSKGMRQKILIAAALMHNPELVLLDEPFSGIDPLTVKDLQETIRDLSRSGIGVLITDHNVRETLNVTDRAYIVNHGKIMAQGTPDALSNDAEVRRVYLGDHFRLN